MSFFKPTIEDTFLTRSQARDAIAADFLQYGPQPDLFGRIGPLILGPDFKPRDRDSDIGFQIRPARNRPFQAVDHQALAFFFIHVLETASISMPNLARICSLVFQTEARAGHRDRAPGIWIRNQMKAFVCKQCGDCCTRLAPLCTEEDWRLWQDQGRRDILAWVRIEADGQGHHRYRIWIDPDTGRTPETCPFLIPAANGGRCGIHEVKPAVCREYPFTLKHGAMTGCRGV